jgi:hypothetical protein
MSLPTDYPHRETLVAGGFVTRAQVRAASDDKLNKLPNLGLAGVKEIRAYEQANPEERSPKSKRVRVLVERLGPNLLKKGEITDDPAVVALLDKPYGRDLVEEVK